MLPRTRRHPQGLFLPRGYVCYRASAPVVIDGNLDKKVWRDAPWTEAFEDHQAPNTPPPGRVTRAAMLWDDDNLYFAARLQEENVWGTLTQRDCVIYNYSGLTPGKVPDSRCEDWIWNSTNCGDLHMPEGWGRVYFSDRVANSEKDIELEERARAPALPAPPAPRREPEDMVLIPAGTFTLGPDPSDPGPSPAHEVALDAYWIDRYPVTIAQFAAFLNAGGHDGHYFEFMANPHECGIVAKGPGDYAVVAGREEYPVVYVSRHAAMAYAAWAGKRLPTEAEWERAARGIEGRTYPWGEDAPTPERANYDYRYGGTTPVGAFPQGATPEGVYDLAGNVKEWCLDSYDSYPGGAPMLAFTADDDIDQHQRDALQRELYSVRGGGWSKQEPNIKNAYRDADGSGRWFFSLGFRCVREAGS